MQFRSIVRALALASAAFGAQSAPGEPAAGEARALIELDLPAQDLGATLLAIARQSGQDILFASDTVRGLKAPSIRGRYTLDEALRAALEGSPLTLDYRAGAAIIRQRGAQDRAADGAAAPPQDAAIVVTGSRIRGAGIASPVTVSTRRELEQAGLSDLADFTRLLPQNYAGGQNRGIPGGGEQGGQQNLNNSATLNLRGLGPDATLTLFNGHRLAYDSVNQGIDISAIPLAAIERIEVVTDGASALYGSDAVGGVANIILRRDFNGLEATARFGASTDGGNVQKQLSLVGGGRWSSGGVMVALDASRASPITAGQRDYTDTVDPSLTLTDRNRQVSAVASAHQQLIPGLTLEVDGYVTNRRSLLTNPFSATQDVHVLGLVSRPHVRSFAVTPTVRAELGAWEATLSATRADSRTLLDTNNYVNSVPRHNHLLHANSLRGVEATAEGPLLQLPGGAARLALGGGARRIALHLRTQLLTGGERLTTREFTERRSVQFAYGELSLPLVQPHLRLPLVERLTLSGALRHEHWNGIGSVTTPKAGIVYQPVRDLSLRGTWGRSFKIPTLRQVNDIQQGILIPGFYFTPPPEPAGSPVLLLSGSAPGLRPERATTWSATAELTPRALPGLRLQATYFDIDYRGRIAGPVTDVLTALGNPLYSDLIVFNPAAAEVNALVASMPGGLSNQTGEPFDPAGVGAIIDTAIRNTERQRIKGVDVSADYAVDIGSKDRLLLTGSASYLKSHQQLAPGQPVVPLAGTVFHPPHWRGRVGAVWSGARASASAFVNHVGSNRDARYPDDAKVGAFTTVDVSATLQAGASSGPLRNVEFRLTVLNLFNEKPDIVRSPFPNAAPFDSTNQSPVGRFVAASIRKVW